MAHEVTLATARVRLAIPHGEFEPRMPQPSSSLATRSRSLMGSSNQRTGGIAAAIDCELAIPHGEFERQSPQRGRAE